MANFNSLNSSKSNMQSVKAKNDNAKTAMKESIKEKKEFAFNKFNVNGENQRGDDIERSKDK